MTLLLKRYGKGEPVAFRNPASIDEMASYCAANRHIEFLDNKNQARSAKVNGQVRRWKRDATRIAVPLKYGFYECFTFDASDLNRVLIPVTSQD